jgi:hypothetical protein
MLWKHTSLCNMHWWHQQHTPSQGKKHTPLPRSKPTMLQQCATPTPPWVWVLHDVRTPSISVDGTAGNCAHPVAVEAQPPAASRNWAQHNHTNHNPPQSLTPPAADGPHDPHSIQLVSAPLSRHTFMSEKAEQKHGAGQRPIGGLYCTRAAALHHAVTDDCAVHAHDTVCGQDTVKETH